MLEKDRPSLILVRTHLGYGSPNKQDTYEAHGSPLGVEEVKLTKQNLGWPLEPDFYIPEEALRHLRQALDRGKRAQEEWDTRFARYVEAFPELVDELHAVMHGELPDGWDSALQAFAADPKGLATRVALGKVLNDSAPRLPNLIGGSGDLDPSTYTMMPGMGDFEHPGNVSEDIQGSAKGTWDYSGRNIHFGIREHAMGAILNGMAVHGGLIPFGATFLIFSDYMRPPIRLAALMKAKVIYVFTHDSIALGEDGPTHQPVEQLVGLRAIPGMLLIRPADANETLAAWRIAIEHQGGPVALVLTRQKVPILSLEKYPQIPLGVKAGAYILEHAAGGARPDIVLVATGSEVHLALAARQQLEKEGVRAQVVSMPGWHLFDSQEAEYKESIFPADVPVLSIEAGSPLGWRPYIGPSITIVGVNQFGSSAPGDVVLAKYGFSVENVCRQAHAILRQERQKTL